MTIESSLFSPEPPVSPMMVHTIVKKPQKIIIMLLYLKFPNMIITIGIIIALSTV